MTKPFSIGFLPISSLLLCFLQCVSTKKSSESATLDIVTSGPCGDELLRAQGVDPSTFAPAIEFDRSKFRFNPAKPKVPGCIHLIVTNSTIKQALKELTAEFELRIGADPDPQNPRISCRQTQKPCSCSSGKTSCVQCDFCKNIQKSLRRVNVTVDRRVQQASNLFEKQGCGCNVPPGVYDMDSEVCTPTAKEMKQELPDDMQKYVSQGSPFSLFTTVYLYNFRFNYQNEHLSDAAQKALSAKKARGLIGCFILASNVKVDVGSDFFGG